MEIKKFKTLLFFLLFLVFWVFKPWFSFQPVAGRDWFFLFPQNLQELSSLPQLWDNQGWGGMGRVNFYQWSHFVLWWPAKFLSLLGFSWPVIEKIIFFWPYLILTLFSCWYLTNFIFGPKSSLFFVFCSLFFVLNTFSLMIVGGGQMGFALAYAIVPLVLAMFIKLLTSLRVNGLKSSILTGVTLAIQVMLDPRVSYITMMAVGVYCVIKLLTSLRIYGLTSLRVKEFLLSVFVVLGLNLFWLLPVFLIRGPVLPETYGESGWVKFLSFARFSDAFSLLHPNWPENIFGKTYFFREEFLLLPILAYISLLFINGLTSLKVTELASLKSQKFTNSLIDNSLIKNKSILYFNLLALIGAFLAKGANPPFGEVYLWLFENVPGFRMFRDPVKFYMLVGLSYSILIPYSLSGLGRWVEQKNKKQKTKNRQQKQITENKNRGREGVRGK